MGISVTRFCASCLKLNRRVETGREAVDIKRRGKVVARLAPPPATAEVPRKPWERLRGSGTLLAEPGESVLDERAFLGHYPEADDAARRRRSAAAKRSAEPGQYAKYSDGSISSSSITIGRPAASRARSTRP